MNRSREQRSGWCRGVRGRDGHGRGLSVRPWRAQLVSDTATARSLAIKAMNSSLQGQSTGSRSRRRRPCATSRPGREKKRSRQAFRQAIAKPPRRPIQWGRPGARCRRLRRSVSPGRPPEPDVRLSPHPALHESWRQSGSCTWMGVVPGRGQGQGIALPRYR